MMRISREEEHLSAARAQRAWPHEGRVHQDGRITAIDMYTVCDNGSYDAQGDGMTWTHRVADVSAAGHAYARCQRDHETLASRFAKPAGRFRAS
jgi:hypothetical protein